MFEAFLRVSLCLLGTVVVNYVTSNAMIACLAGLATAYVTMIVDAFRCRALIRSHLRRTGRSAVNISHLAVFEHPKRITLVSNAMYSVVSRSSDGTDQSDTYNVSGIFMFIFMSKVESI